MQSRDFSKITEQKKSGDEVKTKWAHWKCTIRSCFQDFDENRAIKFRFWFIYSLWCRCEFLIAGDHRKKMEICFLLSLKRSIEVRIFFWFFKSFLWRIKNRKGTFLVMVIMVSINCHRRDSKLIFCCSFKGKTYSKNRFRLDKPWDSA